MYTKLILALSLVTALAACKPAAKNKVEALSCTRQLAVAPPEFATVARTVTGAIQTENCETIAVGTDRSSQPVIAKYDSAGQRIMNFGSAGLYRPLATHALSRKQISLSRLSVMPDGLLVFGWYSENASGDLVALKLKSDGLLNFDFGPKRDGVIYGDEANGQSVRSIEAPTVLDAKTFSLLVTYFSNATGTQYTKSMRLALNGRADLPVQKTALPANCDIVNHTGIYDGASVVITQNNCGSLTWTAQGRGVSDNFVVIPDGTVYPSTLIGPFSMQYDATGRSMLTSLDTLGSVKSEYLIFVTGKNEVCGQDADPAATYLVFSKRLPNEAGFLENCWFL